MVQEETIDSIFYSSCRELFMVAAGVKHHSRYVSIHLHKFISIATEKEMINSKFLIKRLNRYHSKTWLNNSLKSPYKSE